MSVATVDEGLAWKSSAYFCGFLPPCVAVHAWIWSEFMNGRLAVWWIVVHAELLLATVIYCLMVCRRPEWYKRFRSQLLILHLVPRQLSWFVLLRLLRPGAAQQSYSFQGFFHSVCTLWLDLPLRYTILNSAAALPVFTWLNLQASSTHSVGAVVWCLLQNIYACILAPVLLQVAWTKVERADVPVLWSAAEVLAPRKLHVELLPAAATLFDTLLGRAEHAIVSLLSQVQRTTLITFVCYPPMALVFAKHMLAAVVPLAALHSSAFEVLTAMLCCAVVASSEQGVMGLRLGQRLEAAHKALADVYPEHIAAHLEGDVVEAEMDSPVPVQLRPFSVSFDSVMSFSGGNLHAPCPRAVPSGKWGSNAAHPCLVTLHPSVTVLFADIVGFTPLSEQLGPLEVMSFLHDLFGRYDECAQRRGVYKVETIGDCYMAAAGLISEDPQHADTMLDLAQDMLDAASEVVVLGKPLVIRVGLHSGPVTSGLIGQVRRRYCLFGDTVNTASRMESSCEHACIQVSSCTYELLHEQSRSELWQRRQLEVKGKGRLTTYLLRRRTPVLDDEDRSTGRRSDSLALFLSSSKASRGRSSGANTPKAADLPPRATPTAAHGPLSTCISALSQSFTSATGAARTRSDEDLGLVAHVYGGCAMSSASSLKLRLLRAARWAVRGKPARRKP